ncbi:MAG: LysR substrate-binding domain-containing protein [Rickettsiales bacterium]|nr:LysR substrate-binding domain-containing protein [Rickettsiales bacterium]
MVDLLNQHYNIQLCKIVIDKSVGCMANKEKSIEKTIEKDFFSRKSRLTQLRSFCAVVESDFSMTNAAEKLDIEISALSRHILQLEKDMGIKLLDRQNTRRLKFTKEGKLFYDEIIGYVNGIEGSFSNFNEHIKKYNNTHLNIAIQQSAAISIFPKIIKKMLQLEEFKDLEINIFSISKDEAIDKLLDKEVDLAFYVQDRRDYVATGLEAIKSIQTHASIIFDKSHPLAEKREITKQDIEEFIFIQRNEKTKIYTSADSYFNAKLSNVKIFGAATSEITIEMVKNTDNMAIIPNIFLHNNTDLMNGNLVAKSAEYILDNNAFFHIFTLKDKPLSEPVSWIIKELKKPLIINEKILATLKTFYSKVDPNEISWILTGSFSFELRGVDVYVNNDIDILINNANYEKISKLLKDYIISPNKFVETDGYRSYLCKYKINGANITIFGDSQYKLPNGTWSEITNISNYEIFEYDGMRLHMFPLSKEYDDYRAMGKNKKAEAILQKIKSSNI